MAKMIYSYKARDIQGNESTGSIEADSVADLMGKLRGKGLTLIKHSTTGSVSKKQEIVGAVKMKEIIPFTHHLRTMYGAGVPILAGLEDLRHETTNPYFSKILENICLSLKNGTALSDALTMYPKVFPKIYVAMAKVGEATGNLDLALDSLISYLERREETKGRLVSAMIYPIVMIFAVLCLVVILLTFLLPRITKLYTDTGIDLPGPTKFLMAISDFLIGNAIPLLALVGAIGFGIYMCRTNPTLKLKTDEFLLKVPFFGQLMIKDAAAAFCNTLSALQKSGVAVNESLKFCEEVVANTYLKKKIMELSRAIQEGERFPVALKNTGVFPSLVVTMVKVGDESGKVDESLRKVCEFYDKEIPMAIKRFMQIMENLIIFGAGGVVLFIILATLMPIYKLVQVIRK